MRDWCASTGDRRVGWKQLRDLPLTTSCTLAGISRPTPRYPRPLPTAEVATTLQPVRQHTAYAISMPRIGYGTFVSLCSKEHPSIWFMSDTSAASRALHRCVAPANQESALWTVDLAFAEQRDGARYNVVANCKPTAHARPEPAVPYTR